MSYSIHKRLEDLSKRVNDESFLHRRRLGNEVAVWIFDYDPSDEMLVRRFTDNMVKRSRVPGSDRAIANFDLYQIALDIADSSGVLHNLAAFEEQHGPQFLQEAIKPIITPDSIIAYMNQSLEDEKTAFITGVGKVWPWVRSHTVLNNLGGCLDEIPVVLFFPGTFTGTGLRLFNIMPDSNYYRAFQLVPSR